MDHTPIADAGAPVFGGIGVEDFMPNTGLMEIERMIVHRDRGEVRHDRNCAAVMTAPSKRDDVRIMQRAGDSRECVPVVVA